jgi:hypothetical protein
MAWLGMAWVMVSFAAGEFELDSIFPILPVLYLITFKIKMDEDIIIPQAVVTVNKVVVDALPYIDSEYDEPGMKEMVIIIIAHLFKVFN